MILYHYTCMDSAMRIRDEGRITPKVQPVLAGTPVIWLGDFAQRVDSLRLRLGIDHHFGDPARQCFEKFPPCDPVAVRFGVSIDIDDHPYIHPFSRIRKNFPEVAAAYRALPGAHPWRWWFATAPIKLIGGRPTNV